MERATPGEAGQHQPWIVRIEVYLDGLPEIGNKVWGLALPLLTDYALIGHEKWVVFITDMPATDAAGAASAALLQVRQAMSALTAAEPRVRSLEVFPPGQGPFE